MTPRRSEFQVRPIVGNLEPRASKPQPEREHEPGTRNLELGTSEPQCCNCVEIPAGSGAGSKGPQTCRADHRRIVGRERETRNEHRQLTSLTSCTRLGTQAAVRRYASGNTDT